MIPAEYMRPPPPSRPRMSRKAALRHARLGLLASAGRAGDAPLGSVARADARTSANDFRAALSIAYGKPVSTLHPVTGVGPQA